MEKQWGLLSLCLCLAIVHQGRVAGQDGITHETASTKDPITKVGVYLDLPIFMIDGKPHLSPSFETYVPTERHFKQFAEAGTDIFGFPTNVGMEPWWHSTPTWPGECVWNYSEFEESVNKVLAANPDAMLMPRVHIAEPDWWREKYPEELAVYDNGSSELPNPYRLWPEKKTRTYASLASARWRADMGAALTKFIEHIQSASYARNIFGYQLLGMSTEEWYYHASNDLSGGLLGDYNPQARLGFQHWLKQRYTDEAGLRMAWSQPEAAFEHINIPTAAERRAGAGETAFRNPASQMNVIDYYHYYNDMMADTIDYYAGVARKATYGRKVIGAFYAYMFEFSGRPETGHMAVEKLLQSENLDYIVVTASYGQRQLGSGGSILRSPHTSLKLHNKIWYEDNDNVSYLFPQVSHRIGDNEWERSKVVLAATDTAEQSRWIYLRGAGFTLGNGVYESLFDLHGGYFDDPELMRTVADINRLFKNATERDRSSLAEILLIADEVSTFYPTMGSKLLEQNLYDPPYRLIKCGAPYDSIYLNDLERCDTSRYKLIILMNAWNVTSSQEELLKTKVFHQGKTVLVGTDLANFENQKATPDRISELTGISFVRNSVGPLVAPRMNLTTDRASFTHKLVMSEPTVVGPTEPSIHWLQPKGPDLRVLAVTADGQASALVEANTSKGRVIYSPTLSLPSAFYTELARSAGVHLFCDRGDTLYASRSYLTINADGEGTRVLRFPKNVNLKDAVSGEPLAGAVTEFSIKLRNLETRILQMDWVE